MRDEQDQTFDEWAVDMSGMVVHSIALYIATEGGLSYPEAMSIIARTCCRLMCQAMGQKPFTELERVDKLHEEGCDRIKRWFDQGEELMKPPSILEKQEKW